MKPFTVAIEIDLPRARVLEVFDDLENLPKWQPGLEKVEPLSGTPGQPGATMNLHYRLRGRKMVLKETVTRRALPDQFDGRYEWSDGFNTLENRFVEVAPQRTRWESTCTYHFRGMMPKLMGFLFPGLFRKQVESFMRHFKDLCEQGRDVRQSPHAR